MSKSKAKKHHIILILILSITAVFFLYEEFGKEKKQQIPPRISRPEKKHAAAPVKPAAKLKIAIVLDDLGTNRDLAAQVLNIKASLTLSILPQQQYSAWIAEEGNKRGHDIIAHIPMEAANSKNLGAGGLYTWMTDSEIVETLNKDIRSIPHVKGVSSHMGSAFTQDERSINVVIKELKNKKLFFLDSLTSAQSAGLRLAKAQGVSAAGRDVFLDDKDDPAEITAQWKKLMEIARTKRQAVLLAHPRKNTIVFLQKVLKDNDQINVVPLSELVR